LKIFVKLISRQEFLSILFVNRISKIRFQDLKKKEFDIIIERFFFLSILIIIVVARFVNKNKYKEIHIRNNTKNVEISLKFKIEIIVNKKDLIIHKHLC